MIFYLTNEGNDGGMKAYVTSWGPAPGSRMQFFFYSDLLRTASLRAGTYIFTDLEVLNPAMLETGQAFVADAFFVVWTRFPSQ